MHGTPDNLTHSGQETLIYIKQKWLCEEAKIKFSLYTKEQKHLLMFETH